MSSENQKLSFWDKAGYGCGDFASVLFWQTIMVYLFFFYTDVFGLTAAAAGTMMGITRLLDAMFDVGIGITADRTSTRWGKFRPYLLWMALPLGIAAVLAFITPNFGPAAKLAYAYATFILFMLFYSAVNIPYTSLLGVISSDPNERTSASSFKFVGAYAAGFVVSISALYMADRLGNHNPAKGWPITMAVYAVIAVLFFMITFASTRERIQPMAKKKTSIDQDMGRLVSNGPWLMLFLITILFILFVCIRLAVTTHYFKYFIGLQIIPWLTGVANFFIKFINSIGRLFGSQEKALLPETYQWGYVALTSIFNGIGQAFSLIGVLLVPWFSRVVRKKRAIIILFITALVCTGSFYFFSPSQLLLIFSFQLVGSLTGGPISALLWAMYADTADYSEWKTGQRETGLVYSASIMSNKIGWAVGGTIAGFILSAYGFIPNVVQNIRVLNGLKAMMSVLPVAVGVLALIILFFYQLDEPYMKRIKADLEARRKGPAVKTFQTPGLFSYRGRVSRSIYWGMSILCSLLIGALYCVYYAFVQIFQATPHSVQGPVLVSVGIILGLICLLITWVMIGISVKRWHDLGYSGWMELLALIPSAASVLLGILWPGWRHLAAAEIALLVVSTIGSLVLGIWLGFIKGTAGTNKYGQELAAVIDDSELKKTKSSRKK